MHFFDNLQKLQKQYARLLEPACQQWGLTRNEMDVLLFLHNNPELDRAVDIVTYRGIAKSHVSLSVATLEQRGFLCKVDDPADRRTVHLKLTKNADNAVQAGKAAQLQMADLLFQGLNEEEFEVWQKISEKVRHNIENMEEISK